MVGEYFFGVALRPFNGVCVCSRTQSFPKCFSSLFPQALNGGLGNRGGLHCVSLEQGLGCCHQLSPGTQRAAPVALTLINLSGTHTFANTLPQITQLRHLLGIKGYNTVGTCLGQLQPKPGTGMGQPAPDALLFPLVDALVPWQLLKPNSCGESTVSEQLRSPATVAMSWGFFFPPKNPRQRMCI